MIEAEVDDDLKGRYYAFGDKKYRSVTSVLNYLPQKNWGFARDNHAKANPYYSWEDYKDDATTCGTYLHFFIGAELAYEAGISLPEFEPTEPLPTRSYIKKGVSYCRKDMYDISKTYWQDFKEAMRPVAYANGVERAVHHPSGYAGRVDLVLQFHPVPNMKRHQIKNQDDFRPDDVWLVDIKSSRMMDDDYFAQVWAYAQAWNYLFPATQVNRLAVLRLNGETGWEFVETKGNKLKWESALKAAKENGALFE